MRIVGGEYRGRILKEFKGLDIRPTADMTRESLFNILRNRIYGAKFLDLFCGTGAVGIEAISRGAEIVYFNDINKQSYYLTQDNLNSLKIDGGYKLSLGSAEYFINSCAIKFDIIFIDAPYQSEQGKSALNSCDKILADGGIIIFEDQTPFKDELENLEKYDERRYGKAYLSFFRKK